MEQNCRARGRERGLWASWGGADLAREATTECRNRQEPKSRSSQGSPESGPAILAALRHFGMIESHIAQK